ncbi:MULTISPECIES: RrF2 family transcriptional regulator [Chitinophagaceae]|uniref:RrF2 family transcriptional regulator n=1 Tax=Chitinophagaceae TaxID=563835 RepID=UPI000DEEA982|nr:MULTISPECIES: Rrf2 family transcriptional regulator [Chitinophagaceae]RPD46539.1 Rrf2 family transcriptional regulator [Paracnuella aquatica]
MLSTSCKYALRAAVLLMKVAPEGRRLGIHDVAEGIEANEHTTGKILQQLVREGLICSAKGPHGGFYIPLNAAPLPLIDIVRVIDGVHFFFDCGLGLKECSESKPCPIHHQYKAARQALHQQFSTITVQQLAQDLSLGKAFLKR